jgi:secretion/DNA translocation related TadE-like protein
MVRILCQLVPPRLPVGRPSWMGRDERSADRGAATVWVVGGIAIVMAVMAAVYWYGGAVVARHQAEGAADLGALAAAGAAGDGEQAACAEARWVVERMGAALRSCRLSGWDALVEADVGYAPFGSAAARARAGPVELNR